MGDVLKWDESCRVGVQEFDEAHKNLFAIGNRMIRAVVENKGPDVERHTIDELIDYAGLHFRREEELMERSAFPGCTEHKQEHKKLLNDVLLFKSQYIARAVDHWAVATFLIEWIVHHIKNTDKKYGPHLNAKGIR